MKTLSFSVSEETFRRLKKLAKELDLTLPQAAKEIVDAGAESAEEIILAGGAKFYLDQRPVNQKE